MTSAGVAIGGEPPVIRLTNVSYTYPGPPPVAALRDADLVVWQGEHPAARRLGAGRQGADWPELRHCDRSPPHVIGIISGDKRIPSLDFSVIVPEGTALRIWGKPTSNNAAQMLIHTKLGAGQVVAGQVPVALRPDDPKLLKAAAQSTRPSWSTT